MLHVFTVILHRFMSDETSEEEELARLAQERERDERIRDVLNAIVKSRGAR